jgi:RHS repeat-associated protein
LTAVNAKIICILMLFVCVFPIFGQSPVIPPSPNASSLGKYGEIPVGTYTGTPQISLPIGEAKGKEFSVPISLSYHAGGIKVDDIASQVGLGWSLNAGGVITRTIKGLPDESTYGFANYAFNPTNNANLSSALFRLMDTEPDVFFFNVNGYSGKFYLDKVGSLKVVRLIPFQDIDIKFMEDVADGRWVMTTPDGIKYYFSNCEYNDTYTEDLNIRTDVTSWYLSKIEGLTGDLATFSYQQGDALTYRPAISETLLTPSINNNSACSQQVTAEFNAFTNPVQVTANKKLYLGQWSFESTSTTASSSGLQTNSPIVKTNPIYINEIITFHNKVKFNYVNNRQDLAVGALALQSVTISNKSDYTANTFIPVKKVNLEYNYFDATEGPTPFNDDRNLRRLKLSKLTEIGIASDLTETALPAHELEYYEDENTNLPPRLSPKQDHWGYANSNTANTLIPRSLASPSLYNKADRSTNIVKCVAGTIKKVKYPTGGYTEFEFEPHTTINTPELIALSTPQFIFSLESVVADYSYTNSPNTQSTFIDVPVNQYVDVSYALALGSGGVPDYFGYVKIDKVDANNNFLSNIMTYGDANAGVPSTNNFQNPTGILSTRRYLAVGRYKLTAYAQTQQVSLPERSTITVGYYKVAPGQTAQPTTAIIGGVRIKRIKTFENANSQPIVKRFEYNLFNAPASSSGKIISLPKYNYDITLAIICNMPTAASPNNIPYECGSCLVNGIVSASKVPLGSSQGSPIVYTNVSILNGESGEGGKSDIIYSYREDDLNYNIPFAQHDSYEWMRGNVEQQIDYKKVGTNYVEIKKVKNNYLYSDYINIGSNRLNSYTRTGYIIALDYPNRVTNWTNTQSMTRINSYKIYAPWVSLKSSTTTQDGITSTTTYDYQTNGYHSQPIAVHAWDSKGLELKTETLYTKDVLTSADLGIQKCIEMNILTPLEQKTTYNNVFQGGTKNKYEVKTVNTKSIPLQTQWIKLLRNNTESVSATAIYNTEGYITSTTQRGFTIPKTFTWANGLVKTQSFGGLTTSVDYKAGSTVVEKMTDENGLKKKFTYDVFFRPTIVQDRFQTDANDNPVASTVQATTTYNYHYKGQPVTLPNDMNDGNQNFVSTTTTFLNTTNSPPLHTKQYMDGLGRATEVVKEYYTPSNLHQKNFVSYDVLGRQDKTFLPFESSTLGFQAAITFAFVNPYVLTAFEASPLSRPISQKNVDGTFTYMSYGANTAADAVRIMTPATASGMVASAMSSSVYAADSLYKTTMTDENGKLTCVFKDKLGRLILTRKFLNGTSGNVDTYNVYDDYGQLVVVVPPGALTISGATATVANDLTFQYKYDNRNRLIEKKIPGAESQRFYYDERDLLTLTQDGNMGTPIYGGKLNRHLATEYDNLGRVVKTGWVTTTDPVNFAKSGFTIPNDTNKLTETVYYDNKSWVKYQGAKVLKPAGLATHSQFLWSYTERRVTGDSYTGNPAWMGKQHLRYNGVSQSPILDSDTYGVDWVASVYNGMQQPDLTIRYLFEDPNRAGEIRTWQNFKYDNGRRLTDIQYNYGTGGAGISPPSIYDPSLSNMNYNFKDQLIEKNIGLTGTSALQSIDYTYNIRGWLTNINNVALGAGTTSSIMTPNMFGSGTIQNLAIMPYINQAIRESVKTNSALTPPLGAGGAPPVNDNNTDLFSQNISYDNPATQTGATPQYNGNIAATTWQILGRDRQAYGFTYDGLDRLTEAKYFDITGTTSSPVYSTDNKFKEAIQYDIRGNIIGLQRNGFKNGSWTTNYYTAGEYGQIDNLVYGYNTKNQLIQMVDNAVNPNGPHGLKDLKGFVYDFAVGTSGSDHYLYDNNGNLKKDAHKDITLIEYNYLNLPQVITFTGGRTIKFVYDASGAKLKKITNDNGIITNYDYINGVEYKNNVLQRFAHSEGSIARNSYGAFEHEYVLRDHLGNARVTFTDGTNKGDAYYDWNLWPNYYVDPNVGNTTGYNDGLITAADIKQINHYYPFGLNMEGNWQGGAQGDNKYQYNDKELNTDFGLNWSDHHARFYDPAIARWNGVDQLAEKHRDLSPYVFVSNMPTIKIDPDGRDGIIVIDKLKHLITVTIRLNWSEATGTQMVARKLDMPYSGYLVKNSDWKTQPGAFEKWGYKNGGGRKVTIDKEEYTVNYVVDIKSHPKHKGAVDAMLNEKGSNFLTVRDGPRSDGKKGDDHPNASNTGGKLIDLNLNSLKSDPNTISHEIAHLLGIMHATYKDANGTPSITASGDPKAEVIDEDVMNTVSEAVRLANTVPDSNVEVILTNGEKTKTNTVTIYDKDGKVRVSNTYKKAGE